MLFRITLRYSVELGIRHTLRGSSGGSRGGGQSSHDPDWLLS